MRKGQELCFCRVRGQELACITTASPTGMIKQFLRDVDWGEVDYLIVDTPPGTSDDCLALPPWAPVPASLSCREPRHLLLLARTPFFLLGLDCSWALTGLRGHFF